MTHPNQALHDLAYRARPAAMSLTELHRSIRYLARRQGKVWLSHRAARIRVLKIHRRGRIAEIAAKWNDVCPRCGGGRLPHGGYNHTRIRCMTGTEAGRA